MKVVASVIHAGLHAWLKLTEEKPSGMPTETHIYGPSHRARCSARNVQGRIQRY